MRLVQSQVCIDFQVQIEREVAIHFLDLKIVDRQVPAPGDSLDLLKEALVSGRVRLGMNQDVGAGQDRADLSADGRENLGNVIECNAVVDRDDQIYEEHVTRMSNPHSLAGDDT